MSDRDNDWAGVSITRESEFSDADLAHRLHEIGLPHRFRQIDPETCERTDAVLAVRQFVAGEFPAGRCLVLTGPTGVGKTFAAAMALVLTPYCFKRFWYFPGLCAALLDPERRPEAMTEAKTVKLAVWDDFGTEYLKSGGLLDALIDELIWTREAEAQATLITTNLTPDQLRDRLSDRIVDRFRGEWGRVVALTGPSLRGRDVCDLAQQTRDA